jgi:hypothetical protein
MHCSKLGKCVALRFCLNLGNSLNFLLFQATFSFAKGNKSHGTASGMYGGRGMTVILFLARNSEKADGEGAGHEFSSKLTHGPTVSHSTLK